VYFETSQSVIHIYLRDAMMRETMIEETVPGGSVVECLVVAPGRSNKSSRAECMFMVIIAYRNLLTGNLRLPCIFRSYPGS
jgi:hypothetical protein